MSPTRRWDDDANPEIWWADATLEQLADLRATVLEHGHTESIANGIAGWLLSDEPAAASNNVTRAKYRKVLREVGPPVPPGRRRRRRAGAGQAGFARPQVLASVSGGAAAVATAAQTGSVVPLAAGLGLLVITRSPGVPTAQEATQGLCRAA